MSTDIFIRHFLHLHADIAIIDAKGVCKFMAYDNDLIAGKLRRWEKYLEHYRLPAWEEIPDFGLYMEQVVQLLKQYLSYLPPGLKQSQTITSAAINNYVRTKMLPEPRKKKYYRVHIAYLIMICTLKQSLSLSMLQTLPLKDSYTLHPGEFIFVQTREMIHMPKDLIGRIGEKNSRIRQGLSVAGPHYYPGHKTYIYLRIQNITCANITIRENDSIAQIIFEQLESVPEKAYDEQEDASFNDEYQYRGLANYRDEYEARTEELKKANESLEEKENHIYANILTFMGIFVSIFSLIMVNFSNITKGTLTKGFIVPMNLSLGVVIALFMGLILIFLNKAKSKGFLIAYIVILIILIIMLLVAL